MEVLGLIWMLAQPQQQAGAPAQQPAAQIKTYTIWYVSPDGKEHQLTNAQILHILTSEPIDSIDIVAKPDDPSYGEVELIKRDVKWDEISYIYPVLNYVALANGHVAKRVRGFSDMLVFTDTLQEVPVAGYKVSRRLFVRTPLLSMVVLAFSQQALAEAKGKPEFERSKLLLGKDFNNFPPPEDTWPMYQYNPVHSGGRGDIQPQASLAWKKEVGNVGMNIAVSGDKIIIPTGSGGRIKIGHVWALDKSSGRFYWKYFSTGQDFVSAVVSDGIVYAGSVDKHMYALDLETGKLLWKFPADGSISTTPVVALGRVIFGSEDGYLYALDAKTGNLLWKLPTGLFIFSSPIVVGDYVYFGSSDNNLYAVSVDSGYIRWKFKTMGEIVAAPAYYGGFIFVASRDGSLYAVNEKNGSAVWVFNTVNPLVASPVYSILVRKKAEGTGLEAIDAGVKNVYLCGTDGYVYALAADSGEVQWKYKLAFPAEVTPALVNNTLYVVANNLLYALDATTGKEVWPDKYYRLPARASSSPIVVDGMLYIGCEDGYLYALK